MIVILKDNRLVGNEYSSLNILGSDSSELHNLLIELAEDHKDGTPYFLLNYENLIKQTVAQSNWSETHEAIAIGCSFGFIFGEVNYLPRSLKHSTYTSDIYFIYIYPEYREERKGSLLYSFYEKELTNMINTRNRQNPSSAYQRASIEVRIPIKHCIKHCAKFWNNNGFQGNQDSMHLSKFIYLLY